MRKKLGLLLVSAAILALALAACGDGETRIVEVEKPVVVEQRVVQEVPVEKIVEVEKVVEVPKTVEIEKIKEVEVPAEVDTLDIGLMTIRTGFGASFGIPYDTAMQIHADEVNSAGGLRVGNKTYIVNLDVQDSKYEMPLILGIAEKWVSRDSKGFVITFGDPMIGAIDPLTKANKVIHVSPSWDLEPCRAPAAYTFCMQGTPRESAPLLFRVLKEHEPDVQTMSYLAINFRFDLNAAEWTQEAAEEAGYTWLGTEIYDAGVADFLPVANALMRSSPDAVMLGTVGGDGPAIVRAIRDLGYEGVIAGPYATPSSNQFLDGFKGEESYVENFYGVEQRHYFGNEPDLDWIEAEYELRAAGTGVAPRGLTDFYYTLAILLEAIKDAGTADDPDAIAEALRNVQVANRFYPDDPVMSFGGLEKLGQRHQLQLPLAVNHIVNGEIETLLTAIATVK